LLDIPSQSANPGLQETNWQVPFTHVPVAFAVVQVLPHAPQFWLSVLTLTQLVPQQVVPVTQHVTPPQVNEFDGHWHWQVSLLRTNGGWQAGTHWPEAGQTAVPLGQVQMPVKGSQKLLQHSESSRHF
jgi:hypothetical protein